MRCAQDNHELVLTVHHIHHSLGGKLLARLLRSTLFNGLMQTAEVQHRYSEFESLRNNLVRLRAGVGIHVHAPTSTYGRQVLSRRGSVFILDQHASDLAGLYCSCSNKYTV